jgi:carboxypeptidase Q
MICSLARMARTMAVAAACVVLIPAAVLSQQSNSPEAARLVSAMLGQTPLAADLQELVDEIGGRPTGSAANLAAVEWGLKKFAASGVSATKETFTLPRFWQERASRATVGGDASFPARVVAMPFSVGTPAQGVTAPLVSVGYGTEEELARVGSTMKGAFIFVKTDLLVDIDGLFKEYAETAALEKRVLESGVKGIVYMGSRADVMLHRHNASMGEENRMPMVSMAREHALRVQRLLDSGKKLTLNLVLDVDDRGPYESANVIGEIRGSQLPNEVVVIGAHLDSWDLGTGANDNGCNVAMMIDLARQMKALNVKPKRTIRFALWNGEEQGMIGSWQYTERHRAEMKDHVMAGSLDVGSGRLNGFFTNGRPDVLLEVEKALEPVRGLGPFAQINEPIVGTDNYDFMLQGVANIVGNHEPANYGPTYHAEADNFDKVNLEQLRLNGAIVAAVVWHFANAPVSLPRQSKEEVQRLVDSTSLRQQMEMFNLYRTWADGSRAWH